MSTHNKTVIVIPSRYGSSRFPGKPLAEIAGKSLVRRVYELASAVDNVDAVYVATDDERIREHVENFGGHAVMTPRACKNGTDRCFAAVQQLENRPDIVINFQGDAVRTPPSVVQAVVEELQQDSSLQIATSAMRLGAEAYNKLVELKQKGQASATLVTFDRNDFALYFSKSLIPFIRNKETLDLDSLPVYKHIGIYGYRYAALERYLTLPQGRFEDVEQLEQLRALENGMAIKLVHIDNLTTTLWGVDSPEDAAIVEDLIAREGELA